MSLGLKSHHRGQKKVAVDEKKKSKNTKKRKNEKGRAVKNRKNYSYGKDFMQWRQTFHCGIKGRSSKKEVVKKKR